MISVIKYKNTNYIYLHIEQVYVDICKEYKIVTNENNISGKKMLTEDLSFETIDSLTVFLNECSDNVVIDFKKINNIQNNCEKDVANNLRGKKNIYIINMSDRLCSRLGLTNSNDNEAIDYISAFEKIKIDFVSDIGVNGDFNLENGVKLSKYINVKSIIENNEKFFVWSYLLCDRLSKNRVYYELCKNESDKPILFAHTINGACIATMISKLLGLSMIYIDHLGPHNNITGMTFKENYKPYQNYLVVVDFVCQGNEVLRAQNIVEFLGGRYKGFVGMIKLDISQISVSSSDNETVKEAVVSLSSDELIHELKYTIKTELCNTKCSEEK